MIRVHRNPRPRAALARAGIGGLLLAAGLTLGGCEYTQRQVQTQLFRGHIIDSTEAIRRGELGRAEVHLASARQLAEGPSQHEKVRSLETLIEGAEALLRGDGDAAAASWSMIEDPRLRREVRLKARSLDIEVPLAPLAKGGVR